MANRGRGRTLSRASRVQAARVFVAATEKCGHDHLPQWVRGMADEDAHRLTEAESVTAIERAAVIRRG